MDHWRHPWMVGVQINMLVLRLGLSLTIMTTTYIVEVASWGGVAPEELVDFHCCVVIPPGHRRQLGCLAYRLAPGHRAMLGSAVAHADSTCLPFVLPMPAATLRTNTCAGTLHRLFFSSMWFWTAVTCG